MENYEPNIHKQVKLNPNTNNSESSEFDNSSESSEFNNSDNSEPFESDNNSELDNGSEESEEFADLMDNLIRDLSNGERFAITNFLS